MPKALTILEKVYDIRLSTKLPYHTQVGHLDASGELGSIRSLVTALFQLAELMDAQEAEIAALKEGHASTNPAQPNTNTNL